MPNALKNAKFEQFGMKNANMVTLHNHPGRILAQAQTKQARQTVFHFQKNFCRYTTTYIIKCISNFCLQKRAKCEASEFIAISS